MGELFVAREAGPEMVGKIGNRTTVANNEQIVKGISEGVYTAVLAAMKASESNGSQAVNVYLDGRLVTQSVEKRQHERGAAIMGRQVYSY
jgi:ribonuclease HI